MARHSSIRLQTQRQTHQYGVLSSVNTLSSEVPDRTSSPDLKTGPSSWPPSDGCPGLERVLDPGLALEDGGVRLRELHDSDTPRLLKALEDPIIAAMCRAEPPY